ncbi:MAG: hypothetical protein FWD03_04560, partial [Defluviitaleaceae bacterium]|nr:hypothetical protein [Defluviitaleaceae bacterium]
MLFEYILFHLGVSLYYLIFINICKYRTSTANMIIVYWVMCIGISFLGIFLDTLLPVTVVDMIGIIIIMGCNLMFAYILTENKLLSAFFSVLTSAIALLINHITTLILIDIIGVTFEDIRTDLFIYFILFALSALIAYPVSKYLGNQLHSYYTKLHLYKVKHKFAFYGLFLSSLTFFLLFMNTFFYGSAIDEMLQATINVILAATTFLVAIYILGSYAMTQQQQLENEYLYKSQKALEDYTQNLEKAFDDMKLFRHDHLNLLYAIMGYTDGKEGMELLQAFLNEQINTTKNTLDNIIATTSNLSYIHISELKGLLAIKLVQAQNEGIKVNLDVSQVVNDIPISRMDLCRLSGIIVDNAIDELTSDDYKGNASIDRTLNFGILDDGSDILVICSNTCKNKPDPSL